MKDSTAKLPAIKTVMLIDDEYIDQMMYTRLIERTGLVEKIISHTYAEEALAFLKSPDSPRPDVIFLDINMPRMNGFEFLETAVVELGPDFAEMIVVMLTTSLNPSDREHAERYAVVKDFISKPLTEEHLQKIAKTLLAKKS